MGTMSKLIQITTGRKRTKDAGYIARLNGNDCFIQKAKYLFLQYFISNIQEIIREHVTTPKRLARFSTFTGHSIYICTIEPFLAKPYGFCLRIQSVSLRKFVKGYIIALILNRFKPLSRYIDFHLYINILCYNVARYLNSVVWVLFRTIKSHVETNHKFRF